MKTHARLFSSTLAWVLALGLGASLLAESDPVTNTPPSKPVCPSCQNSRRCQSCRGEGTERCNTCQGKGKDKDRCTRCGGDGRVSKTTRISGKTRRTTGTCSTCGGKGYREKTCSRCGGDGKISCSRCQGQKKCPACKNSNP